MIAILCKLSESVMVAVKAFLLALITYLGLTSSLVAETFPDIIDRVRPSVVGVGIVRPPKRLNAKSPPFSYLGTGFAVDDGLTIVTNHHVIPKALDSKQQESLAIFVGQGESADARIAAIVATDPLRDLALLRIEGEPLPALGLAEERGQVREGSNIAFTGFPIGMVLGLYPVTHRGIVSAITPMVIPANTASELTAERFKRLHTPFDVFQLDATAYPGNSGSPLYLPESGQVIGVINSVFVKEGKESMLTNPSAITYAIPVRYVRELLHNVDTR